MTLPIRWLHLSDFHVGKDDYASRKMFDYIIKHVHQRTADGFVPDLVFVTGDLANKGRDSEYEEFWLEFVAPLHEAIGGDIGNRTFVVPGNHDVDRDQHPAFSREEMSRAASRYFDPTEQGRKLREMLMPRFLRAFVDNDLTQVKSAFEQQGGCFSTLLDVRGRKVGIVGTNTAWLSKDEHDERKLTPGKPLLEHALATLTGAELRIVLGHHPLDWLLPEEQKPIKSLLSQHSVLYLHGHLHEVWVEPTYGGGHEFLVVQSGAAFQAREGERWRNGLLWGEVDLSTHEVRFQPWRWTHDQQGWTLAADAFPENVRKVDWWIYALPGSGRARRLARSPAPGVAQPPRGWAVAKPDELRKHVAAPLEEGAAIRFFNGAVPGWQTALSASIPRRKIVEALAARFQDAETASRPIVTLLLAAGCEGKTTALLQAAYEVVHRKPEWQILRRVDDAEPLKPADILPVLSEQHRWLVVLDEADRAANDLVVLMRQLPPGVQGRVHFLIACRDSDWRASDAYNLNWSSACTFHQQHLAGLGKQDAEAIVTAWAAFGKQGLGDLASVPEEERASVLDQQAREEAKTAQGAFFGALLTVRHGSDLPNHARLMLERLGLREIPSGGTLRDALAFIAVMHAERLEFLSRPVLAQALGCPLGKLRRDLLAPLGEEAAVTTTSSFIFTRHRRVAEAIVSVLEKEFAEDVAELFMALGRAAIDSYLGGEHVPDLAGWRYRFPRHFFDTGRRELALDIARGMLAREPDNFKSIVNLANLYRKAEASEKAVEVFRGVPPSAKGHRGFYYEWANAEGGCGDQVASTILAAFSISDDCAAVRVDNDQAKYSLAGLGVALGELFSAHHEVALRDARIAVAVLGQQLVLDPGSSGYFRKYLKECTEHGAKEPTVDQAFNLFRQGVIVTEAIGVNNDIASRLPAAANLTFGGLQRLIYASMKRRKDDSSPRWP